MLLHCSKASSSMSLIISPEAFILVLNIVLLPPSPSIISLILNGNDNYHKAGVDAQQILVQSPSSQGGYGYPPGYQIVQNPNHQQVQLLGGGAQVQQSWGQQAFQIVPQQHQLQQQTAWPSDVGQQSSANQPLQQQAQWGAQPGQPLIVAAQAQPLQLGAGQGQQLQAAAQGQASWGASPYESMGQYNAQQVNPNIVQRPDPSPQLFVYSAPPETAMPPMDYTRFFLNKNFPTPAEAPDSDREGITEADEAGETADEQKPAEVVNFAAEVPRPDRGRYQKQQKQQEQHVLVAGGSMTSPAITCETIYKYHILPERMKFYSCCGANIFYWPAQKCTPDGKIITKVPAVTLTSSTTQQAPTAKSMTETISCNGVKYFIHQSFVQHYGCCGRLLYQVGRGECNETDGTTDYHQQDNLKQSADYYDADLPPPLQADEYNEQEKEKEKEKESGSVTAEEEHKQREQEQPSATTTTEAVITTTEEEALPTLFPGLLPAGMKKTQRPCPSGYICCPDFAPVYDPNSVLLCCDDVGAYDPGVSTCIHELNEFEQWQ